MSADRPSVRVPLTRERVLLGAVAVADAGGLEALTMRSLAAELGVKPMAVYHHVSGKAEILDGVVDLVFSWIAAPRPGEPWRGEMRRRAESAREVLLAHPWAVALLDSRTTPGPSTLRHHDATLGVLRAAGFSVAMAGHASALLDAFVYGFVIQEIALPFPGDDPQEDVAELAGRMLESIPEGALPHLVEFATQRALAPGYEFAAEFGFGLDLILDGLERAAGVP